MQAKQKEHTRLRRRFVMGLFAAAVIPVIIIAWGSIHAFRQTAINDIKATARRVAEHRGDAINTFLRSQINLLSTLMRLYPPGQLQRQEKLDELLLAVNRGTGDIAGLQFIAANGGQAAGAGLYRDDEENEEHRHSPWFREAMADGSSVHSVSGGLRDHSHFAVALADPDKTFVLRAAIPASVFHSLPHSDRISPGSDAFILNADGTFLTPSLRKAATLNEAERGLLRRHSGTESASDNEYFYAGAWLNGDRLLLLVKMRITDSLTGYFAYRNRIIAGVSVTAVLLLAVSYAVSRFMTERIRRAALDDQCMTHIEKMAGMGRRIADLVHEGNNSLHLIQMQADWIDELLQEADPRQVANLEECRESAAKIKQHLNHANSITRRLFDTSQEISAG